jgi:large subunit ribosomal protein L4
MASYDVINSQNQKVGSIDLADKAFGREINEHQLWEVVRSQMAARRSGSGSAKTRAELAYTNTKMYRQKGTGRARAGSRRSGVRVGGGAIHGPKPKEWSYKVPKKVRANALAGALTQKAGSGKLMVVDEIKFDQIKTKDFIALMNRLGIEKALFVIEGIDRNLELSSRNIPYVKVLRAEGLNVYDVLRYENLVVTKGAVEKIQQRLAR